MHTNTPTVAHRAISVSFGSRRPAGGSVSVRRYSTMPLTGQAAALYTRYNDINMAKANAESGRTHTQHTKEHRITFSSEGNVLSMLEMKAARPKIHRQRNKDKHIQTSRQVESARAVNSSALSVTLRYYLQHLPHCLKRRQMCCVHTMS